MRTPNQPPQESDLDSSWPLFSLYSNVSEHEDSEVEVWREDAGGIVIFTGLFSAALAAFLAVTVQDLKPNIQATSALHLGNIYQVLADPNVTRPSTPFSAAETSSFSPPRYAVWVNSLWFLSLVMSLSCALWATLLQQRTRRYLRRAYPTNCSPEKRARMRAFFAGSVGRMDFPLGVDGLPALLHFSLFLFFWGLAIFLFNVNRKVFCCVISWIGLFFLGYGTITVLPIVWHDTTYWSPFSTLTWKLYTGLAFITFKILAFITYRPKGGSHPTWKRYRDLGNHYRRRLIGGMEKAAEETVSERLPEIDARILEWTVTTLGNDNLLEKFFEAIPGFLNSKLVTGRETDSLEEVCRKLSDALDEFWDRTLSSNSASDEDKLRRLDITLKAMNLIRVSGASSILHNILFKRWDEVPQTLEMGQSLAHWCTVDNEVTAYYARSIVARVLASVQKRDDNWVSLAVRTFGLPEHDLWNDITGGDNMLFAIFIHVTRQSLRPDYSDWMVLEALSRLEIGKTLPRLQHEFCMLWNEIVQEARKQGPSTTPVYILNRIRHLYIPLHQGTDAPKAFSASTNYFDPILRQPLSYPLCKIDAHRRLPTPPPPHHPANTASRQAKQTCLSSNPATSHAPDTIPPINPVYFGSCPTGASPTALVAAAPQETATQDLDIVIPTAEPETSQVLSTAPAPPTGSATLPRLRARGLVNCGKTMCFANSVLQLLVNSPPSWNLFKELCDLKAQREAGVPETGGDATPLVDATVKFFKEFIVEEEEPSTQQQSRPDTGGSRADSFEPTYLYDAMKKKEGKLKCLLEEGQQDAEEFLGVYLDALDEELHASIKGGQSDSATLEVEECEVFQSGQTEGNQGFRPPVRPSNKPKAVTKYWRSLQLDVKPDSALTVQDALIPVFQSQSTRGGPSCLSGASQQMLIETLPPGLVLHLKRFQYDATKNRTIKIGEPVQIPLKLEIPSNVMVPTARQPAKPLHYTLCGVLYHHGESASGGHYTVNVLHPNGEGDTGEDWLHIDDEKVTRISRADVFGEDGTKRVADKWCAYILFYCRTSPIRTS